LIHTQFHPMLILPSADILSIQPSKIHPSILSSSHPSIFHSSNYTSANQTSNDLFTTLPNPHL